MRKGYWIARADIENPGQLVKYLAKNGKTLKPNGATYLARAGKHEVPEGGTRSQNTVFEFPLLRENPWVLTLNWAQKGNGT